MGQALSTVGMKMNKTQPLGLRKLNIAERTDKHVNDCTYWDVSYKQASQNIL